MTITILFSLLLLANTTTQQQEAAIAHTTKEYGFLTYENYTYAIRIQYPSDWVILEPSQRGGSGLNIVVIFRSPPENSSDTKVENLLIQVGNLPFQNIPLDEVISANINNLKQSLIDFELVEINATTVSGNNPAYKVVYTNSEGEDKHKTMQILSIKEEEARRQKDKDRQQQEELSSKDYELFSTF